MKALKALYYIVTIALILWFVASYLEIVTHNLSKHETGYEYSKYNLFEIMLPE